MTFSFSTFLFMSIFSSIIIQPVYKDPEEVNPHFRITKSQSCPNLFMYDDDEEADKIPRINRERAFSVCSPRQRTKRSISSTTMHRIQSDSDLSHIDKEKTFATDSRRSVMPGDLLAKIVVALGGYRDNDDQKQASIHSSALGVHGFSDSQILASEQNYDSDWSIGSAKSNITPPGKQTPRVRAVSEIRIPMEESEKVTNLYIESCRTERCLASLLTLTAALKHSQIDVLFPIFVFFV